MNILFKMRKCLLLALLMTISLANASAQITLGYCGEGEYTSSLTNNKTAVTISVAMGVTPALQNDFTFCSISYLRFYLTAPENFTSFSIWIRHKLTDTEDLTSLDLDPSTLAAGWNDIALPNPIALNGTDTYYCGYSYQQSVKTKIPLNGEKGISESVYVMAGSSWRDMSAQYAPVCIRAGLSSNYQHALELTDLRLEQRFFEMHSKQDTVTVSGTIRNLGNERLHHFTVTMQDNGSETISTKYACDSICFGERIPFEFSFEHSGNSNVADPDIPIVVTVGLPNDAANQCDHSIADTLYYEIGQSKEAAENVPKSLFVEEFTSEANGYAPAGQTHLRNSIELALEQIEGTTPEVILLSRHEGYGPADAWHIPDNDYQASFFGADELTFVPAAMVGRSSLPFSTTLSEDSIAHLIAEQCDTQHATIVCEDTKFDPDSHILSATIKTHLLDVTKYKNPTLVVCIKQEKVASVNQKNYYPEKYNGEWQQDIARKFFALSNNGRLFGQISSETVAAGQAKVEDYVSQEFSFSESIPNDIASADGLFLVAYIFDKNHTNKIIAAQQVKL